jgi:hypothetical protein
LRSLFRNRLKELDGDKKLVTGKDASAEKANAPSLRKNGATELSKTSLGPGFPGQSKKLDTSTLREDSAPSDFLVESRKSGGNESIGKIGRLSRSFGGKISGGAALENLSHSAAVYG